MKLLKEVSLDADVTCQKYEVIKTTHAILLNNKNEIALLHARNGGWFELPGGELNNNESIEQGLMRECLEEVGAKIKILDPIGITIEFRNTYKKLRINYCHLAKIIGELGERNITDQEKIDDIVLIFLPLKKAIELMKNAKPFGERKLVGMFKIACALAVLEEYASA